MKTVETIDAHRHAQYCQLLQSLPYGWPSNTKKLRLISCNKMSAISKTYSEKINFVSVLWISQPLYCAIRCLLILYTVMASLGLASLNVFSCTLGPNTWKPTGRKTSCRIFVKHFWREFFVTDVPPQRKADKDQVKFICRLYELYKAVHHIVQGLVDMRTAMAAMVLDFTTMSSIFVSNTRCDNIQ